MGLNINKNKCRLDLRKKKSSCRKNRTMEQPSQESCGMSFIGDFLRQAMDTCVLCFMGASPAFV